MHTVAAKHIIKFIPSVPKNLLRRSLAKRMAVNRTTSTGAVIKVIIPAANCTNGPGGNANPSLTK